MTMGISMPALPHQVDEGRRLAVEAALAPIHHHAADGGIGLDRDGCVLHAAGADHFEAELLHRADDLLDAHALEVVRVEVRRAHEHGEAAKEVHAGEGSGGRMNRGCVGAFAFGINQAGRRD